GTVTVYAAGAPLRVVAAATTGSPVVRARITADGLLVRSEGGFFWLGHSRSAKPPIGVERLALHRLSDGDELVSRNYVLEWNTDAWVLASLYRFSERKAPKRGGRLPRWRNRRRPPDRASAEWEDLIVGRPREL